MEFYTSGHQCPFSSGWFSQWKEPKCLFLKVPHAVDEESYKNFRNFLKNCSTEKRLPHRKWKWRGHFLSGKVKPSPGGMCLFLFKMKEDSVLLSQKTADMQVLTFPSGCNGSSEKKLQKDEISVSFGCQFEIMPSHPPSTRSLPRNY